MGHFRLHFCSAITSVLLLHILKLTIKLLINEIYNMQTFIIFKTSLFHYITFHFFTLLLEWCMLLHWNFSPFNFFLIVMLYLPFIWNNSKNERVNASKQFLIVIFYLVAFYFCPSYKIFSTKNIYTITYNYYFYSCMYISTP